MKLVLALIIMSALDAAATLTLIDRGTATEANFLMAALIEHSVGLFWGVKMALTASAALILAKYQPQALVPLSGLYGILMIYHGVLLCL